MLLGLAFLGVSKTRVRKPHRENGWTRFATGQRTSGHFQRISGHGAAAAERHAKFSGATHARTVAGAAVAGAHPIGPARAVRFVGIVPLLRRQKVPPGAHMPRRRSRGVQSQALVSQQGQAQDAAERMELARAPHMAVTPPTPPTPAAAEPARLPPLRRGGRSAISLLCSAGSPPLHGRAILGYVRAELRPPRAFSRVGRPPSGQLAVWPL